MSLCARWPQPSASSSTPTVHPPYWVTSQCCLREMVAVATWDERAEQVAPINLTDSLMCVCDFIWSCDICASAGVNLRAHRLPLCAYSKFVTHALRWLWRFVSWRCPDCWRRSSGIHPLTYPGKNCRLSAFRILRSQIRTTRHLSANGIYEHRGENGCQHISSLQSHRNKP